MQSKGTCELRFRRVDGSTLWTLCSLSGILNEELQCQGTLAMVTDVTSRKQAAAALELSERQFREVFEGSQDAMAIVSDPEGECLDVNAATCALFELAKSELVGRRIVELFGDGIFAAGLAVSPSRWSMGSCDLVRKDSSIRKVEYTVRASFVPQRTLWVLRDVTERHILEEQLRQAQKMEAIGRLAGGVAHDFNNLLMAVSSYAELLQLKLTGSEDLTRYVREILAAATRASNLTAQLLAFSHKQVMLPQVLDPNTVVLETSGMLKRLVGESVRLTVKPGDSLGRIRTDRGQFEQVILNLAINARDAMPDGGQLLIETSNAMLDEAYCRSHPPTTPGEYVMLAVSDSGCGINPRDMERIFEPFFTTKKRGRGTGLGLATVYGIVQQAGGFIWVYSEPQRGTTFKIYLPRVHESLTLARDEPTIATHRSGTVLLVEDEAGARQPLSEFLAANGYTVLEATDGMDATRVLDAVQNPVDVLVTDMVMPGMTGPEVARRVKARFPTVKVLFMSGYTEHAVVQRGLLDSEIAFLQKPFTLRALVKKLELLLKDAD